MIKISKYRQRIKLQFRETVTNENGFTSDTWTDFYSCWSYVNGLSGKEYLEAMETQSENTVSFKVRYSSALKDINSTDYRIIFKDDIYDITYVDFVRFENESITIKAVKEEV